MRLFVSLVLSLHRLQSRPGQPRPGGTGGLLDEVEVGGNGLFFLAAQFVMVAEQLGEVFMVGLGFGVVSGQVGEQVGYFGGDFGD